MKMTVLGLAMISGWTMGCAHGTAALDDAPQSRELRGSARVGQEARAIVAGPALLVHAAGDKPVRWFVVPRVSGGDVDCAAAPASAAVLPESTGIHLTIEAGHVLCATVAQGATEVVWHQVVEGTTRLWALR